jgi:plasmid stability protein
MSKLVVRDLNPEVVARLEVRARSHGVSLEAEAKAILEAAAPEPVHEARRIAEQWQQRLAGQVTGDSAELIREDRQRC